MEKKHFSSIETIELRTQLLSELNENYFNLTEKEQLEATPVVACSVSGGTTGCS